MLAAIGARTSSRGYLMDLLRMTSLVSSRLSCPRCYEDLARLGSSLVAPSIIGLYSTTLLTRPSTRRLEDRCPSYIV
jgi:hypothetical protein